MTTTLAPPPVRELRPVTEARGLIGRHLVVAFADADDPRFVSYVRWEYRACSEVFNEGNRDYLRIATARQWQAWEDAGKTTEWPRGSKVWPAQFCWYEAE